MTFGGGGAKVVCLYHRCVNDASRFSGAACIIIERTKALVKY
jgi:hypothetical protein